MKQKGFTLIEILAVISILGILALVASPLVIKTLNKSRVDAVKVQESNLVDAANLLKADFCDNPISSTDKSKCRELFKTSGKKKYICVSSLKNENYYENIIEFNKTSCVGYVMYSVNENGKYVDGKTYLKCGEGYSTDGIEESLLGGC